MLYVKKYIKSEENEEVNFIRYYLYLKICTAMPQRPTVAVS